MKIFWIDIRGLFARIFDDFNCEDVFRIFELDGRGFLDKDDLKYDLNLLNVYPSDCNTFFFTYIPE